MCGHLWREMFVSKKNFTICCLFSLQFLRPLFSDLLIGGLPPNSKHDEKKKMQAEEPSQIGMFLHNWVKNFEAVFEFWYSYTKRNDRKVSNIKDESFECLILKSSNLLAFGLVGFLFGLTLTLCFCCFVDAEEKLLVQSRKFETFKDKKLSSSVLRFFYNLFQNIYK